MFAFTEAYIGSPGPWTRNVLDEIPIVKEIGDRFESSIQKSMLRSRSRGPSIAVAAFAVMVLVLGVPALLSQQNPDTDATATVAPRGIEEPAGPSQRSEAMSAPDLAAALPTPDGMASVDGPQGEALDGLPGAGISTLKFVTESAGNPASITVNIIDASKNPTRTEDDAYERVTIGATEASVVSSGSLLTVTWEPLEGLEVQIVGRGALTREYVLQFANEVDRVATTATLP